MKSLHSMIAVAALAFALPAQAATSDPEVVLYRGSGVVDSLNNGGSTATAFSCTPFSGASENIRVVIRAQNASILANSVVTVSHLNTVVFSTNGPALFSTVSLATGIIFGGTVAIAATSTSVVCTAMLVQVNNLAPEGIHLHLIRFNPLNGTQE